MNNSQSITEKDCPIEPVWVLKSALPSILGSSITFIWFFLIVFPFNSIREDKQPELRFVIFGLLMLFILLPMLLHFLINIFIRKNFHYSLDDKFLNVRQGILSKQNRHLPYGVIQNVMIQKGILDRIFNLATLTIENAASAGGAGMLINANFQQNTGGEMLGFKSNLIRIPGLSFQNAENLKNLILEKIKANPIEEIGM